ncbi:MAG: hypothetical protein U0996_24275 [Planctomycetaceae bacterium]
MSGKCDVRILFDRSNRTWRGGESVTGRVIVTVNLETKSNGIRLTHSWKTHGRGNTDSGPKETELLQEAGMLLPGQNLEFPFSFSAPLFPVTYHGHLISIDHYVTAEVDVSWARNPSAEEDFIVLPGAVPTQFTGARDQIVSLKPEANQSTGMIAKIILFLVLGALLVAVAMLATLLLPVVLIVAVWLWLKSQALKMRLGKVELAMPIKVVAPGESWPVSLKFTARRSFVINSISLKISGIESAASGSGTDKTTHTHQLLLENHLLREGGTVEAGETVEEILQIPFPDSEAFSFEAADNSIKWTAEVRIDIPRFPDWTSTETLQLVPTEFVTDYSPATTTENSGTLPSRTQDEEEDENEESERRNRALTGQTNSRNPAVEPVDDMPTSLRRPKTAASIMDLVTQLNAVSRHSTQRAEIVKAAAGSSMVVSITIERVVSTIGSMVNDEAYDSGKTVSGTIDGTRQAIQVLAKPASTPDLERLSPGDSWKTTISPVEWDTLYNRINAREV